MKRLFLICIILLTFKVFSCSCIGEASIEYAFHKADVVAEVEVLSVRVDTVVMEDDFEGSWDYTIRVYSVKIKESFKGVLKGSIVEIASGMSGGDCGYIFEPGKVYIVYARKAKYSGRELDFEMVSTDICTRTCLFDVEEKIRLKKISN